RRQRGPQDRPASGNPVPPDPQDPDPRSHARAGHRPPDRADHPGHLSGQAGVALSRSSPAGGEGLAGVALGRVGESPAGKVLPADPGGRAAAGHRDQDLDPDLAGDPLGPGDRFPGGLMSVLPRLASLARNPFQRSRAERELDQELREYVDLLIEAKIAAGMAPKAHRSPQDQV